MFKVVTDLAMLGFHSKTREMMVESLHPGVTLEQVRDNTGFDIKENGVDATEPPLDRELAVLRELDPERLYIA
jgi:glutaconate CoA-transferase, subunit B